MLRTRFLTLAFFWALRTSWWVSLVLAVLVLSFSSSSLGSATVSSVVCTDSLSGCPSISFPSFPVLSLTSLILLFLIILWVLVSICCKTCLSWGTFQSLKYFSNGIFLFMNLLRRLVIFALFGSGLDLNNFFDFLTPIFLSNASFSLSSPSFSLSFPSFPLLLLSFSSFFTSSTCNWGKLLVDLLSLAFWINLADFLGSTWVKFLLDLFASFICTSFSVNTLLPVMENEGLNALFIFSLNSSSFWVPGSFPFSSKRFLLLSLIKYIFFFLRFDFVTCLVPNIFFPCHL